MVERKTQLSLSVLSESCLDVVMYPEPEEEFPCKKHILLSLFAEMLAFSISVRVSLPLEEKHGCFALVENCRCSSLTDKNICAVSRYPVVLYFSEISGYMSSYLHGHTEGCN